MPRAEGRALAIVNPASGGGRTLRRWPTIRAELQRHLGRFDEASTEYRGHATAIARSALSDGYRLIVAIGGDGTLSEVANGFFTHGQPHAQVAALGHIPQGTGCDFGRTLGLESDWRRACARFAGGELRTIDVGHVEFVGHEGESSERVFVNVASFGCGGAVSGAVQHSGKRIAGRLAFTLTTFRTLMTYRDQPVSVSFDGDAAAAMNVTNLAVCNARYFGGGMRVAPTAQIDDGQLDITIWAGFGLRDFILKYRKLFDGSHVEDPRTLSRRARHLRATSDTRVLLDVDGENPGRLPATFSVIPSALRLWT